MEIASNMDLEFLRQRMGATTAGDAERMRTLLVAGGYRETSDIEEYEWLEMLDQAAGGR